MPQKLEWTESLIERFWNFAATWEPYAKEYFSRQAGVGVIEFLDKGQYLRGRVLDFGCGPGYLFDYLLQKNVWCEGIDTSRESVDIVNSRFAIHPRWNGAKLLSEISSNDYNNYDLILCIETMEHLISVNDVLHSLLQLLKPQTGRLFITTPNDEALENNFVYCPNCDHVFHRWQHLNSFSARSLSQLMERHGFHTELCSVTKFSKIKRNNRRRITNWSLSYLQNTLKQTIKNIYNRTRYPNDVHRRLDEFIGWGDNLFWVGYKD